ncbi:MAG: hypothetical protein HYY24_06190 [Verrucomicrobia bacterium]|nr:hypothetical protein [Verrucomicrobiota bacterium]
MSILDTWWSLPPIVRLLLVLSAAFLLAWSVLGIVNRRPIPSDFRRLSIWPGCKFKLWGKDDDAVNALFEGRYSLAGWLRTFLN